MATGPTGSGITAPPRLPDGAGSRAQAFGTGLAGDPGSAAGVQSMNENSARYNALVPHQFRPGSLLNQTRPSMNAESAADYARVLPGGYTLPTANGQSAASYEASIPLKLAGQDSQ